MTWLEALSKFANLLPRCAQGLGLVTGFLLYAPQWVLVRCGFAEFAQDHRPKLVLAFLVSLVFILEGAWDWFRKTVAQHKLRLSRQQCLRRLTEHEKHVLRRYVIQQTRAMLESPKNPVVQCLVTRGILIPTNGGMGDIEGMPHHVAEWAWQYLNKYPNLLLG